MINKQNLQQIDTDSLGLTINQGGKKKTSHEMIQILKPNSINIYYSYMIQFHYF